MDAFFNWLAGVIKEDGFRTGALAVAAGLLFLVILGWFPSSPWWVLLLVVAVFLVCGCLCVASILRAYHPRASKALSKAHERRAWTKKLKALSEPARALLYVIDTDGMQHFYYPPNATEITELLDEDILRTELRGTQWAQFYVTNLYATTSYRNRLTFRVELKSSPEEVSKVYAKFERARKIAKGLGGY